MEDLQLPVEGGSQRGLKPARTLPDFAICRARRLGNTNLAYCLVDDPYNCQHALSFGYANLCLHPERDEIISRMKAGH